jgi:hypothetical protein
MKKIVKTPVKVERVVEVVTEERNTVEECEGGLTPLLGKTVFFHCSNYNYIGTLSGVNHTFVEVTNGGVVFDTGPYTGDMRKNYEKLPTDKFNLMISSIEMFMEFSK